MARSVLSAVCRLLEALPWQSHHEGLEPNVYMSTDDPKRMGRPPLPQQARRSRMIRVRATDYEVLQFQAVGGAEWFRQALQRAFTRIKGDKGG